MIQWIVRVSMLGACRLHARAIVMAIVMPVTSVMVASDMLAVADVGLMTVT